MEGVNETLPGEAEHDSGGSVGLPRKRLLLKEQGSEKLGQEVLLEESKSEEMRQVTPPGRRWPTRTPTPSVWGTLDLEAQHHASSSKPRAPCAG